MRSIRLALVTTVVLLIGAASVYPQTPATGIPPFATINIQNFDQLNVSDFDEHFAILIARRPGRGHAFNFVRSYDSAFWTVYGAGGAWYPNTNFNYGWNLSPSNSVTGFLFSTATWYPCNDIDDNYYEETTYDYVDTTGADHAFDYNQITSTVSSSAACPGLSTAPVMINAKDGSGYFLSVDPGAGTSVVYDKHGTMYDNCHSKNAAGLCQAALIDSNGNEITENVIDATHFEWYDTASGSASPVLKIAYTNDAFGKPQTVQYNVDGVTNPYIEKYIPLPAVSTPAFSNPNCSLSTSGIPYSTVPSELDLPNGQSYIFSYDDEARISTVKLPTGSTIHYSYGPLSCYNDLPENFSRWIDSQAGWQYTQNDSNFVTTPYVVTETDPAGNQTQYSFNAYSTENQRKIYQGSVSGGTLLRTTDTCYDGASSPCVNQSYALPVQEKSVATALDNGRQSRVNTYFDTTTYANVTEQDDYDFGASSPTRKTVNTYTGGNFPLLTDTKVLNGSGTQIADTRYFYDGGSLQPSGVTTQLTTPASGIPRGNLTGVSQWVGGSQYLGTTHTYYDTGQLYSTTDPNQNTTYYFYDTAYAGAWLTRIQRPTIGGTQYAVSFAYDAATGLMTSSTDENGKITQYAYDELGRPTVINYPDGGETAYTYVDTPNAVSVEEQRLKDVGQPLSSGPDTIAYYDGQGRMIRRCSANGEATPEDRVDTTWDAMDRVQFQSYPYQAGDCTTANTEPGDTFAYDALGRSLSVTHSDGSQISYSYAGAATEVQDEGNGSSRVTHVYQNDGLGRLVSVCEVTSQTGAGSSSTPSACSNQIAGFPQDIAATGFETGYSYDLLGNLAEVQQAGLSPRTFAYDALSRLLSAANPEAGTTSYTYDGDGNVLTRIRPAPNQTNPAVTVSTSYSYDALNRLLSKTYSDGTPTASYIYDWGSAAGLSLSNTVGRLALERTTDANGAILTEDIFSYDAQGRVTSNWQDPGNGPLYPFAYSYDLLGDRTQQSQPTDATATSFTLSGAWNRAGRLTGLTSSYTNSATHPSTLLSGVHYDAWGHVTALSTTNGAINETRRYDGRGRLWETRGNPYYVVWEQYYAPDGAVTTLEDAANGNWTYTYDALNRLQTAACSANCPGGQASLDLGWTYDRLGNRWSQSPTAGTAPAASASFTGKDNRLDADSYDAAGNLLGDGSHTYTYDAENRIVGVGGNATANYAYDAAGRRVSTTVAGVTRLRLFDEQGRTVRRIDASGQWLSSEIYALGQPLATYDQSGATGMAWFMDVDPVGTIRTITNGSGQFAQACTSLPFGDDQTCSPAISDPSPLHFTGKPRDAETGLDDFGFRYNSSTLGRWMTPDDGSDQDPNDPQSWNLYSYVRNNPVNNVDPDGHDCVYMNDTGNAVESIDNHSSPAECQATGGAWADGTITNVTTDPNSNNILIQTAQLDDNGNIVYVTTETAPGQWSPGTELDQVAVGIDSLRPQDFVAGFAVASVASGGAAGVILKGLGAGAGLTTLDIGTDAGTSIDDILASAARQGGSRSQIFSKEGGFEQAQSDFDSLPGHAETRGSVRIKELPNGDRAVLRNFSSSGQPTLEIQPQGGGYAKIKIRY